MFLYTQPECIASYLGIPVYADERNIQLNRQNYASTVTDKEKHLYV